QPIACRWSSQYVSRKDLVSAVTDSFRHGGPTQSRGIFRVGAMPSSSDVPALVHCFADCELDEMLFQLRRRGRVVKIEPKVFDVLAYLLRHRERVVSKAELLDTLWPDQAVSESV